MQAKGVQNYSEISQNKEDLIQIDIDEACNGDEAVKKYE